MEASFLLEMRGGFRFVISTLALSLRTGIFQAAPFGAQKDFCTPGSSTRSPPRRPNLGAVLMVTSELRRMVWAFN